MTDCKLSPVGNDSSAENDELTLLVSRLQESEKRFHQIFNQQFQCMLILDSNGVVESINDTALKAQGASQNDYIGKPIWEGPAWKNIPTWEAVWKKRLYDARISGMPVLTEDVYHFLDETLHFADVSTTSMKNDEGECSGFIIQAVDTTSKVAAKDAMVKQKDLLQKYLDTVQAITVALDKDGLITMLNPAAEKILKRSSKELLGKSWFRTCLPQPEGLKQLLPKYKEMINGENDFASYFENEVIAADSNRYLIAWHNAFLRDHKGRVIGSISSGQNITEQKAQNEKLRLAQSVFEFTSDGVMITDLDARIVDINPAFTKITGYTKEDALGCKASLLSSGRHDLNFYSSLWERLIDVGEWQGKIWNKTKAGKVYSEWLSINSVYDDDGELKYYVAILSNIKKFEEPNE